MLCVFVCMRAYAYVYMSKRFSSAYLQLKIEAQNKKDVQPLLLYCYFQLLSVSKIFLFD